MPSAISYLDFDLLIRRVEGGYRAQVLSSPAGEATADFRAPFSDLELENLLLRVGRPRRGTRRIGSPEMEAAKTLGKGLYDSVFSGDIRACWRSSLSEAEAQNAGLRLRLRVAEGPELNDIPWEYLYDASLNRFLSLSEFTPLIRYLDLPERIRPFGVDTKLEILVMISSPADYPGLDVENEWSRLNQALAGLIEKGQVRLERLADARLSVLQRRLRGGEYHVLHFIGHGGFDPATQDGVLVLCDEAGKGRLVSAEHLGTLLHDHRSMRLVVLNACEGSRSSRADPFAGVAQTLVQQGLPAVIAMQFEITDQAAITFAEELYAATAGGYPVDAALAAARKAIFAAGNDIEWGTPVLFLRAPDGRLFSVDRGAARPGEREAQQEEAEAGQMVSDGNQTRESPLSFLEDPTLRKTLTSIKTLASIWKDSNGSVADKIQASWAAVALHKSDAQLRIEQRLNNIRSQRAKIDKKRAALWKTWQKLDSSHTAEDMRQQLTVLDKLGLIDKERLQLREEESSLMKG